MAKSRTQYACQECGHRAVGWHGRCPACGQWNTMVEERSTPGAVAGTTGRSRHRAWVEAVDTGPVPLGQVSGEQAERMDTGFAELDRVLGGGLVKGSLVLMGGDPGVGKSTLLLQAADHVAARHGACLYVSGEESAAQIALRARRLGAGSDRLYVLSETDIRRIEERLLALGPVLAVIDSIQTMFHPELASAPGSVAQVRECAAHLLRLAKTSGTAIVLVGHVTKSGELAGPRTLEHATDVVLYFEGERHYAYRLVRSVKNRFGSTHELGLFEMEGRGLREVPNPSEVFLAERPAGSAGSVVTVGMEGTRPLLVEIQALVTPSPFPYPRRTASGLPVGRVDLVMAVLEKRVELGIAGHDAYLKVSGGMRLEEPAADLAVALALASSVTDCPAHPRAVVFGEVGLAGEVRSVSRAEDRVQEAARLGFELCVLPEAAGRVISRPPGNLDLVTVTTLREAMDAVLNPGPGGP